MIGGFRARCRGDVALDARLEPWMADLCEDTDSVASLLELHGSPVNLLDVEPMGRNAREFRDVAAARDVALDVFFARKANKTLAVVDAAHELGLGLDLASEAELEQSLARGVPADRLMMTAAIKTPALLERCLLEGVTVAVDNHDELERLSALAAGSNTKGRVALRLAPRLDRPPTRFGLTGEAALAIGEALARRPDLVIEGVHFHLDGYDPGDRVRALGEAMGLVDGLRAQGHPVAFVDMGGGAPMSYLDSSDQWNGFWDAHRAALSGRRDPVTLDNHRIAPEAVYPAHQRPVRGDWLAGILDAELGRGTVAEALRTRDLVLRMEPGRSLMDGVGLTAATVEYRKQRADGTWLVGLAMNRTQCRSAADDFLVDPLLLHPSGADAPGPAIAGHLVGAYCIERELITWRRLVFGHGVAVGDIVVFPNTAGYFMHILESASHQMPLARNLVRDPGGSGYHLDAIEHLAPKELTPR